VFKKAALAGILCFILQPPLAGATVHTVRQDGTGDFLTITDAVAAAAAGDTVEVGAGVYADNVTLDIALTIMSTDGSAATIIEGAQTWVINAGPSRIEGFSIQNMIGRGLFIDSAVATISDCKIYSNRAPGHPDPWGPGTWYESGGGAYVQNGAVVEFDRCRFDDNFASRGGAAYVESGSHVTLRQCRIIDNTGWGYCAGVNVRNSTLDVIGCLFAGNRSTDEYDIVTGSPEGLDYENSTGSVTSSTFYNPYHPNRLFWGVDVELRDSSTVPIERCIFASEDDDFPAIYCHDAPGPRSCNIYFKMYIWGDGLKPDELLTDPLFCDAAHENFRISTTSTAAPENNPCGQLIGAFGPACDLGDPFLITVRKDGTGDYTSIPIALAEVWTDGYTLEIGPGTWSSQDPYLIEHAMTIRSSLEPDPSIITGFDQVPLFVVSAPGKTVVFEGLTLRDGLWDQGAALSVAAGDVDVTNCVFEGNVAGKGAASYASGAGSSLRFSGCFFYDNQAVAGFNGGCRGGAVYAENGARVFANGCEFSGNSGRVSVLGIDHGHLEVDSCLFVANQAYGDAVCDDGGIGAVSIDVSQGRVTQSTFYGNHSIVWGSETATGAVVIDYSPGVVVERNIISGDTGGAGVYYRYGTAGPRSCNVYWDNYYGGVVGDILEVDEVEADPQFCDPSSGDFTLSENSPAAPQSGVCPDLAGAFPVGCNQGPVTYMFRATAVDGGVDLDWVISSDVTLAGCWVSRERVTDGQTTRIPESGLLDHTSSGLFDTTSTLGQSYLYKLLVVDDQGTEYPSYTARVKDGFFSIDHFAANRMPTGIELKWASDASEPLSGYYIRRENVAGGGPARIPAQGLIGPADTSARDENVSIDTEYRYYLVVVDGRQTEHESQPVLITSVPFRIDNFHAITVLEQIELEWDVASTLNPLLCYLTRKDVTIQATARLPQNGYFDGAAGGYVDDRIEANHRYRYLLHVRLSQSESYSFGPVETVSSFLTVHEFSATEVPGGVELGWDITTSDSLLGCYIDRYDPANDQTARLPEQGFLDPDPGRFVDEQASQGTAYRYSLIVVDWLGGEHLGASTELTTAMYRTDLSQNQPNPFNPGTTIPYSLEEQMQVTLTVFDVAGRRVRTLVDNVQPAGAYSQLWDGTNDAGQSVASGVYLYRLRAGTYEETRKMTLVR
jgi:hypothetical protein